MMLLNNIFIKKLGIVVHLKHLMIMIFKIFKQCPSIFPSFIARNLNHFKDFLFFTTFLELANVTIKDEKIMMAKFKGELEACNYSACYLNSAKRVHSIANV